MGTLTGTKATRASSVPGCVGTALFDANVPLSHMSDDYECDLCGETFDTKDRLREHSQERHTGEQLGG